MSTRTRGRYSCLASTINRLASTEYRVMLSISGREPHPIHVTYVRETAENMRDGMNEHYRGMDIDAVVSILEVG